MLKRIFILLKRRFQELNNILLYFIVDLRMFLSLLLIIIQCEENLHLLLFY